jgi:hypothetical protein
MVHRFTDRNGGTCKRCGVVRSRKVKHGRLLTGDGSKKYSVEWLFYADFSSFNRGVKMQVKPECK